MKRGALVWAESLLLQAPVRLGLGGLMGYAAYNKLGAVQSFAEAIKGFRIIDADTHGALIVVAAFTIPWVEMLAGALLVLGLWTRAAAWTIALLLLGFIAALVRVILDPGVDADCSCFGDLTVLCDPGVGWCQVVRNLVLLIPAAYLIWRRAGTLSLDAALTSRRDPAQRGHDPGVDDGHDRA